MPLHSWLWVWSYWLADLRKHGCKSFQRCHTCIYLPHFPSPLPPWPTPLSPFMMHAHYTVSLPLSWPPLCPRLSPPSSILHKAARMFFRNQDPVLMLWLWAPSRFLIMLWIKPKLLCMTSKGLHCLDPADLNNFIHHFPAPHWLLQFLGCTKASPMLHHPCRTRLPLPLGWLLPFFQGPP